MENPIPKTNNVKDLEKYFLNLVPYMARVQLQLLEFEEGRVKMRLPYKGNENHIGTMTAASLFTLAEFSGLPLIYSAFGMNVLDEYQVVVAQMEIKFLRPSKSDVEVEVTMAKDEV